MSILLRVWANIYRYTIVSCHDINAADAAVVEGGRGAETGGEALQAGDARLRAARVVPAGAARLPALQRVGGGQGRPHQPALPGDASAACLSRRRVRDDQR